MRLTIFLLMTLISTSLFSVQKEIEENKNKLVEFKGFDEWEIWCIDIAQSGNVQCNLNQVLRYKDHPDFRALILRFFSDGEKLVDFTLDREWQTSLSRGYIQVDNQPSVSLANCGSPCNLQDEQLSRLSEGFTHGANAVIRIHDFVIQEYTIPIELDHFPLAIEQLHQLAAKYAKP